MELKENDSESYEKLKEHWEWMNFKDWVEFVLYIEW
jgi:predicted transposase YbfD/YdcC